MQWVKSQFYFVIINSFDIYLHSLVAMCMFKSNLTVLISKNKKGTKNTLALRSSKGKTFRAYEDFFSKWTQE